MTFHPKHIEQKGAKSPAPDEFHFISPALERASDASKGGSHAPVSGAGCTVNEGYQNSETSRLCRGLESPRQGPRSRAGQPKETACIQQGPHSTIQGEVINRLPGNRVAIRCNGQIYTGPAIQSVRRGKV